MVFAKWNGPGNENIGAPNFVDCVFSDGLFQLSAVEWLLICSDQLFKIL